jgi:tRNA (guanine-N7-)-methyltransferase
MRHHKRRLISPETLKILARVMKSGAQLRIGSDITDYIRATLEAIFASSDFEWLAERPEDWRIRPKDWPQTRYEKKAIREGRKGHCLIFRRI